MDISKVTLLTTKSTNVMRSGKVKSRRRVCGIDVIIRDFLLSYFSLR
jgi:hypothetical protein